MIHRALRAMEICIGGGQAEGSEENECQLDREGKWILLMQL